MLSFVLFILTVSIILYLSLIFESTGLALLGLSAVLFAVLSFFYLLFIRKKVRVKLEIPVKVAEKGQDFGLRIDVTNRFIVPIGKLVMHIEYGEDCSRDREEITLKMFDIPKGKSSEIKRLAVMFSGNYEFSTYKVKLYDYFGIFHMKVKKKSITHALILPELNEVPVTLGEGVKNFYGEALVYDELNVGQDPSETFDVREFRDGDKLQRVHWKLSARMDDLIVKETAQPKACPVVLFMPEGVKGENGALDYMASLSFTLMDMKCPHYVVWNSASRSDLVRVRVDDEESFYLALTVYMQDNSEEYAGVRKDRYKEKYKGEFYLHGVFADSKGGISLDGADPVRPEKIEELLLK